MESVVSKCLGVSSIQAFGRGGGGCINEGRGYKTNDGDKIYVKYNTKAGSRLMFEGEFASLKAIEATGTVRVPKPLAIDDYKAGSLLVMEHLELQSMNESSATLGLQLAQLHMSNASKIEASGKNSCVGHQDIAVHSFGFDMPTCCGFLPLDNTWNDDWLSFYAQQRLAPQMGMEEVKCDREAQEWWGKLQRKLPNMFEGLEVKPSLLHGDLWSGNVAQLKGPSPSPPVIFDPASFYGHSEFEFGIITMFGGFDPDFFQAYHSVIPKSPGFEKRIKLYKLFHQLNHWNHFGSSYRSSALNILKQLSSET